jgi:hypothetical protein
VRWSERVLFLLSQYFSGKREERMQAQRIEADKALKQMDFDRLNLGVYNQVCALISEVGNFVYECRTHKPVDLAKMEPVVNRLVTRIYMPDVANALTPGQAHALYEAAGTVELAYRYALQQPWAQPTWQNLNMQEATRECKVAFKQSCETIAFFWHEMEDEIQAQYFKAAADAADS